MKKRGWRLLLLFVILLCLLASCIDPEKAAAPETENHTETEEETTEHPDSAQPTLPADPGWTKPY